MNEYDKRLDFDSDTFEGMKHDMNFVLQRLLGNMIEKQSTEGSMTIKIDVTMVKEFIPNYDPNVKGESREINKPQFKHKVTSAVKISDEKSGNLNNEMEMVMNEENGCYVLQPIANTQQELSLIRTLWPGRKTRKAKGTTTSSTVHISMRMQDGHCLVLLMMKNLQRSRQKRPSLQKKREQTNRQKNSPENRRRKNRKILRTTSWEIQTQKVMITKIRRNRHGTD